MLEERKAEIYRDSRGMYKVIQIQTELHSYLDISSFGSLDDKTHNIFGYMKRKCREASSFYLIHKCSPTGEAKSVAT